jgi:hypothetical protein
LNSAIELFITGIFALCAMAMQVIASADDVLGEVMDNAGIDPQHQVFILLIVTVMLVILALRVMGGLLGWLVLAVLILLLMHRIVPGMVTPDHFYQAQNQTSL